MEQLFCGGYYTTRFQHACDQIIEEIKRDKIFHYNTTFFLELQAMTTKRVLEFLFTNLPFVKI